MTFLGMFQLFNQRMDFSGSPDFTKVETSRLLNWGYDAWYNKNRPMFNDNQNVTVRMTHLLRPFSFTGKSVITVVGVGTDLVDYKDLATMKGRWAIINCDGEAGTIERSITPIPMSSVDSDDPLNKPTDEYPGYTQDNNGTNSVIRIYSDTTPTVVSGNYFKVLQVIDITGAPDTNFEAPDYIAREVIELAKVLGKTDVDDYTSVQTTVQENAAKI